MGGRRSCRLVEVVKNYNDFKQCQSTTFGSQVRLQHINRTNAPGSDNMRNHIPRQPRSQRCEKHGLPMMIHELTTSTD